MNSHDIILDHQFGFRSGHSAQDQLILSYDFITNQYNQGKIIDMILFDFRNAFDLVLHNILLNKLRSLGYGFSLLDWIADFLLDREMSYYFRHL